jgi:hypothetical protein
MDILVENYQDNYIVIDENNHDYNSIYKILSSIEVKLLKLNPNLHRVFNKLINNTKPYMRHRNVIVSYDFHVYEHDELKYSFNIGIFNKKYYVTRFLVLNASDNHRVQNFVMNRCDCVMFRPLFDTYGTLCFINIRPNTNGYIYDEKIFRVEINNNYTFTFERDFVLDRHLMIDTSLIWD